MLYLVHLHSTSSESSCIHTTNDQTFFGLSGFKLLDNVEKNDVLRKHWRIYEGEGVHEIPVLCLDKYTKILIQTKL